MCAELVWPLIDSSVRIYNLHSTIEEETTILLNLNTISIFTNIYNIGFDALPISFSMSVYLINYLFKADLLFLVSISQNIGLLSASAVSVSDPLFSLT